MNSIAYLLTEIEVLRRRYELRPRLVPESLEDEKTRCDSKPHGAVFRPAKHLQQRMRDNQKQKSFLTIAKWAICDARRFDEKVRRLKNLIDGLEDISKAAGITEFQSAPQSLVNQIPIRPHESPPPYSVASPLQQAPPTELVTTSAIESSSTEDLELFEQYTALKQYSAACQTNSGPRRRARDKFLELQDRQLKELRVDVYDELCRRRQNGAVPPFLPSVEIYHPKRNQARERLFTIPWYRFAHLVTDVVFELERRFPALKVETVSISQPVIDPASVTRTVSTRNWRHGCVPPRESPPPLLRYRVSHPATLNEAIDWPLQTPLSRHSQTSTTLGQAVGPISSALHIDTSVVVAPPASVPSSPTIFMSFRVNLDDPAWKVIPEVMKKYQINKPWKQYSLYILYGDTERRLELDEKPLALFKILDRQGKDPRFMLRKLAPTDGEGLLES